MAEYKYDNPQLTESFKKSMNEVYGASAFQYPRYDLPMFGLGIPTPNTHNSVRPHFSSRYKKNEYNAFTAALAIKLFGTNSRVKKIIKNKTVIQEKKGKVK